MSHPHLETMPPAPATNLVCSQPLLHQLFAALPQHRAAQRQRLVLVELALVQQDAKVLQQRRLGAWCWWQLLESLDDLRGAQDSLQNPDSQVCHTVKLEAIIGRMRSFTKSLSTTTTHQTMSCCSLHKSQIRRRKKQASCTYTSVCYTGQANTTNSINTGC